MELNTAQQYAIDIISAGHNIFLTGQAGTGKSFLLKRVVNSLEGRGKIVGITSTTGVSALLVGGVTIHRWSGIQLGELDAPQLLERARKNGYAMKNWKQTSVLIIDEVSMLTPDTFEKLDYIGRNMRWCDEPFGGIQLILTGDFCQLPPVATDAFCFQSPLWKIAIDKTIELTQIMRQNDPVFQKLLSEVRMGIVTDLTRKILQSCVGKEVGTDEIKPTKLYSHRAKVDEYNNDRLKEILTPENHPRRFVAQDAVKAANGYRIDKRTAQEYVAKMKKSAQARDILDLAEGAQVMLIHNLNIDAGLVNGSRGVVIRFEEQRPVVKFMNGVEEVIQTHEWEFKISDKVRVVRRQLPLILAWAQTCHKAQGATLDCVEADLGDDIFENGQFYTALSRVKSLDCLSISQLNLNGVKIHPDAENFYRELRARS